MKTDIIKAYCTAVIIAAVVTIAVNVSIMFLDGFNYDKVDTCVWSFLSIILSIMIKKNEKDTLFLW